MPPILDKMEIYVDQTNSSLSWFFLLTDPGWFDFQHSIVIESSTGFYCTINTLSAFI